MRKRQLSKSEKIEENRSRRSLTFAFSLFVFIILTVAIAIAALVLWILSEAGVTITPDGEFQLGRFILFMSLISLILGGVIAYFSSRIPLKPINDSINKMNRLAKGDFNTRLEFKGLLSSHPAVNS